MVGLSHTTSFEDVQPILTPRKKYNRQFLKLAKLKITFGFVATVPNKKKFNRNGNDRNKRKLHDRSLIRPTEFYGCPVTLINEKLPFNSNEAIISKQRDKWQMAMQDELFAGESDLGIS